MIYLVEDAAKISAEFVEGLCYQHPKVLQRVNDAQRRLMLTGDYNYTIDQVNICTQNNSITLPREYKAARVVNMNGSPVPIESRNYEFLFTGPGGLEYDQFPKLISEGVRPVFFDPPTDYSVKLWAASTSTDDAGKSITFRARASNGAELLSSSGSPLQTLTINAWDSGVEGTMSSALTNLSTDEVHTLTTIQLPEGLKGYVSLYAVEESTQCMWFLSKYHPSETTPGYQRYHLPVSCKDGIMIQCLCKKQYVPATLMTDVLLIQNIDAIKDMVKAIEADDRGDVQLAQAFKQMAVGHLQLQQEDKGKGERFTINIQGFGMSEGLTLR